MRGILLGVTLALTAGIACGPADDDVDGDGYEPVPWRGAGSDDADDADDADDDADDVDDVTDDDDAPIDPPDAPIEEPEEAEEPEAPAEPTPDPDGWPDGWSAREQRMLELVNAMRASGGDCPSGHHDARAPLTSNPALRTAARLHSKDMVDQDYFGHDGLDGSSFVSRIYAAGYDAQAIGENIAAGNAEAEATFSQWVNSDGHCRNMMSGQATEIGIGYADGGGRWGAYWTQTFGAR